jgi:hypothetical protein
VNWGDLWHYPFWADVWGTAAEWAGAIATGGAFAIAAAVYIHDANLTRSAQAKLIHARILGEPIGEAVRVYVENYSSNSVFFLQIELRRIHLWKAVKLDSSEEFITSPDPNKAAVSELVKKTSTVFSTIPEVDKFSPREAEKLEASDQFEFSVKRVSVYQEIFLTFTDAKGKPWQFGDLAGERPRLRKAEKVTHKRGRISAALYRLRHPWTAQKEIRTRARARWRAFIEGLKIWLMELVIKAMDDEKVKAAFRESIDTEAVKKVFGDAFKNALVREIERRKLELPAQSETQEPGESATSTREGNPDTQN